MTNAEKLQACAFEIQGILTDKFGDVPAFVVVVAPHDELRVEYLSNAERNDAIKMLKDTAKSLEGRLN